MKETSTYFAIPLACALLIGVHGTLELAAQTTNYTITVPAGHSIIANHLDHGSNTVAELIPNPPEGTLLFKFDAATQGWSTVDQFEFGAWAQPNETIRPGEGVHVATPTIFQVTFSGTVPATSAFPELKPGWNLVSLPVPGTTLLPTPGDGDQIYMHPDVQPGVPWVFQFSWGTNGVWEPPPVVGVGEGFWYFSNSDPSSRLPVRSAIYVNNYAPFFDLDAQFTFWDGCTAPGLMDGTNWLGQLYAGPNISSLVPIGQPTGFISGYIDTSFGAVWSVPGVQPGAIAQLQIRFWDSQGGTIKSYSQAIASVASSWQSQFFASPPLGGFGAPPSLLPPPLAGLQSLEVAPFPGAFDMGIQPAEIRSFLGGQAKISAYAEGDGPFNFQFQWQKSTDQLNWSDLSGGVINPNGWASEYTIQPVTGLTPAFTASG